MFVQLKTRWKTTGPLSHSIRP